MMLGISKVSVIDCVEKTLLGKGFVFQLKQNSVNQNSLQWKVLTLLLAGATNTLSSFQFSVFFFHFPSIRVFL